MKKVIILLMALGAILAVTAQSDWIHIFTRDGRVDTGKTSEFSGLEYIAYDTVASDTVLPDTIITDTVIDDTIVADTVITDTLTTDIIESDYGQPDLPEIPDNTGDSDHPGTPDLPDASERPDQTPVFVGCDSVEVRRHNRISRYAISDIDSIVIGTNIPTLYIEIEEGKEVTSKVDYLTAMLTLEGYGEYEDFGPQEVSIRGRGNATWGYPKKPYRLKFAKKQSLCGMKKAKSYVLLANQLDCSLMRNFISMKTADMLGMPYTNSIVPVNLMVNGTYRGSYMLTEKVGITSASVDIDEEEGIFWEIDAYFDEDYKFRSDIYQLPVMVKDPDLAEIADIKEMGVEYLFGIWQADFNMLERSVWYSDFYLDNPDKTPTADADWTQYLDVTSLANFLLVNDLAWNAEISYPKSTYLYKPARAEKYVMGPVWDFDWAYNFPEKDARTHSKDYIFADPSRAGYQFFHALWRDGRLRDAFRERLEYYRAEILPELMCEIDRYAGRIEVSALQNAERWPECQLPGVYVLASDQPKETVANLKQWLRNRVEFISSDPNYGLFPE